ncbi:hypothetical protein FKW77_001273 [Venturia effusa]|uniref:Kinesin motor domain-containing protein n=1 Tax=Venturia effusa TaxID=50376 RepID=A0A517LJL9_9PEZI|nr:hypothetical protein FKW77_001273 [Venturia effusa]
MPQLASMYGTALAPLQARDTQQQPDSCRGCDILRQGGDELAAHLTVTQDNLSDREHELEGVRKELEIMSEIVACKADKALSFLRFRSSERDTISAQTTVLKLNTASPNMVGLSRPKLGNNFQNEEEMRNFEFDTVLYEADDNNDVWHALLPFTASLHIDHSVLLILDGPTSAGKSWTLLNGPDPIFLLVGQKMLRLRSAKRKLYLYALEARTDGIWDAITSGRWEKPCQGYSPRTKRVSVTVVDDAADLRDQISCISSHRKTASTDQNSTSSRSHLFCVLTLAEGPQEDQLAKGTSFFALDLAGNEKYNSNITSEFRSDNAHIMSTRFAMRQYMGTYLAEGRFNSFSGGDDLGYIFRHYLEPGRRQGVHDLKVMFMFHIHNIEAKKDDVLSTLTYSQDVRNTIIGSKRRPRLHQDKRTSISNTPPRHVSTSPDGRPSRTSTRNSSLSNIQMRASPAPTPTRAKRNSSLCNISARTSPTGTHIRSKRQSLSGCALSGSPTPMESKRSSLTHLPMKERSMTGD